MTEFRTARLLLRPATLADAPAVTLGLGDFAVARQLTAMPWPFSLAMAIDWLRQSPAPTPDRGLFIVEVPGQGLAGCVTLSEELGFWIARRFWNRGYATEAAAAVLDWHFAGSAAPITAAAHRNNHASHAVQRKLGFVPVGEEMRFSQALQSNIVHRVSRLEPVGWQARERAA